MAEQQLLPLRPRKPKDGEPAATAWMLDGDMVNAFPGPPCTPEQWARKDRDGYWSSKGYSEAPLYLHPPAVGVPASEKLRQWKHIGGCRYPDCHCPIEHQREHERLLREAGGESWPPNWDGRDKAAFERALGVSLVDGECLSHQAMPNSGNAND